MTVRQRTFRHPLDGTLLTIAPAKHHYARVCPAGKVHRIQHSVVHWDEDPPKLRFVLLCRVQHKAPRHIYPVDLNAVGITDLCARCAEAEKRFPERVSA